MKRYILVKIATNCALYKHDSTVDRTKYYYGVTNISEFDLYYPFLPTHFALRSPYYKSFYKKIYEYEKIYSN